MVCENYETCIQYKQPVPKPAVRLPLATDFNETVAVDLHELEPGLWYLQVIDEFTRFSAGSIMKSRKSSEFVKKFLECWLSKHGAPKRLFSDNGGEFNNEEVCDLAENFNMEMKKKDAYSPWSNGLLERHMFMDLVLTSFCMGATQTFLAFSQTDPQPWRELR